MEPPIALIIILVIIVICYWFHKRGGTNFPTTKCNDSPYTILSRRPKILSTISNDYHDNNSPRLATLYRNVAFSGDEHVIIDEGTSINIIDVSGYVKYRSLQLNSNKTLYVKLYTSSGVLTANITSDIANLHSTSKVYQIDILGTRL